MFRILLFSLLTLFGCEPKFKTFNFERDRTGKLPFVIVPDSGFHLKNNIPIARIVLNDLLQHEKVQYLKNITEQRCESQLTLFVPDRMYKVDSVTIQTFVNFGAPESLWRHKVVKKTKPFPYWYLGRLGDVEIPKFFAMKTAEQKCMIGGVNLSIIMYNDSRTEADLVVDFQEYAKGDLKLFYSVHLIKVDDLWQIDQKVYLTESTRKE